MGGIEIINTILSERTLEQEIQAAISGIMMRKADSVNTLEQEMGESISSFAGRETEAGSEERVDVANHFFPRTSYFFHEEEFIAGLQYNAPVLDYEKLWYGESKTHSAEYKQVGEYVSEVRSDATSDMLTVQEAEETFMDIQYHAMLGKVNEVNSEKRRKFGLWIAFNPALFKLLESTQGLTREVNYGVM